MGFRITLIRSSLTSFIPRVHSIVTRGVVIASLAFSVAVPVVEAKTDPNRLVAPGEILQRLPRECRSELAQQLSQISIHSNDPLMESNIDLATRCGIASIQIYNDLVGARVQSRARGANIGPIDGLINFETPHVHPIDITPNGNRLVAVNTAAHKLEVWEINGTNLSPLASIPVGLDPVSVRARTNNEVWVVNHISDTVSIVDINRRTVTRTLSTDNEPADVVFAGSPVRAFVSASESNRINVFDLSNLDANPQNIAINGEDPRALAVSASGNTVYAAIFESGNNTRINAADGFTGGGDIVRGTTLADNDVAVINANNLNVGYRRGLMNIVMALDVHPETQLVHAVGIESFNDIATEPALNGKFIKVHMARFAGAGGTGETVTDLNPHLDYSSPTVSNALRNQSIGDPRGIAWRADGQRAFITGLGSDNVVVINANGNRVDDFSVGEGPTGIVLKDSAGIGFVMNKFDGSISVINTNTFSQIRVVDFDDPTPAAIKAGRPFIFNTHLTSGTGHTSCASCHVDARTDRLGWQLSDGQGTLSTVPRSSNFVPGNLIGTSTISSNKDVMTTQSLIDIMEHPRFHWRGDRETIDDFNGTFVNLMGRSSMLSQSQLNSMKDYLRTLWLPPNPYRNIDNSRPTSVRLPDGTTATSNRVLFDRVDALRGGGNNNNCLACHSGQGNATRNFGANIEIGSNIIAPALPALYDKMGFTFGRSGFGFFHNGATDLFEATRTREFMAEILTLEGPEGPLVGDEIRQAPHAGVGQQVTVNGAVTSAQNSLINQFVSIANDSSWAQLVAHSTTGGLQRGFVLRNGNTFDADIEGETETTNSLLNIAASGDAVTFTLVATGMATRIALDSDLDGTLNNTNTGPDTDGDGVPDSTDTDDDNDGVLDIDDAFPLDSSESVDTDGDGTGNNADTDDDGDGVLDEDDLDPLDPNVGAGDNTGSIAPGDSKTGTLAQGDWQYYTVTGSGDFSTLNIRLTNMTGDLDVYVSDGSEPTEDTYDCRSWNGGNDDELCGFTASDTIIIGVHGYRAGSYTLSVEGIGGGTTGGGTTDGAGTSIEPGDTISSTIAVSQWNYFTVTGTDGFSAIEATLTGLSEDIDLYVRDNAQPTLETYDCRSWISGTSDEACSADANDSVVIGVYGYRAGNYTLTLTGNETGGTTDGGTTDGGADTIAVGGTLSDSLALGDWLYFTVENPDNLLNSVAALTNLSADLDLYVRVGAEPTEEAFDCRSWVSGTADESCGVNLSGGTAYIGVHAYQAGSFTLSLSGGADVTNISVPGSSSSSVETTDWNYYKVLNAEAQASVLADLTDMAADGDLYMKIGALPSLTDFDCRSFASGTSNESCSVNPNGGDVFIGIFGYQATAYTLATTTAGAARKADRKLPSKEQITKDLESKSLLTGVVNVGGAGAPFSLLALLGLAILGRRRRTRKNLH